ALLAGAAHTGTIVTARSGHPGHPGAVVVLAIDRVGIVVVVHEVPAVDVVDLAVAVIVDTVARDLARVRPEVGREIRMCVHHAVVDDRDDDARAARGHVPGRDEVGVGADEAATLSGVPQVPLVGKHRVVGDAGQGVAAQQVRLRPLYPRLAGQRVG